MFVVTEKVWITIHFLKDCVSGYPNYGLTRADFRIEAKKCRPKFKTLMRCEPVDIREILNILTEIGSFNGEKLKKQHKTV